MEHWHYNPEAGHIAMIGLAIGITLTLLISAWERYQRKHQR